MSSIPGIDSRAPERTETSSGSSSSPSVLPACSWSRSSASSTCSAIPSGSSVVAHVGDARLGGDREARRDALLAEHARHLGDVGALAAEQVAHVPRALGEVVDPLRHRRRALSARTRRARRRTCAWCSSVSRIARSACASAGRRRVRRLARAGARARRPGSRGRPGRAGSCPPRRTPHTTPPAAPEKPTRCSGSPHDAQVASCGAKPAASSSLSRKASALARVACGRVAVEQRELVGEQVVDAAGAARRRRTGAPTASHARAAPSSAAPLSRSRGVAGERLGARDRQQVAAALVEHEVEAEERLQAPAEARLGAPHALRDRAHPAAIRGIEVQDAVGLAVADAAQHDRLGLQRAGHRLLYLVK